MDWGLVEIGVQDTGRVFSTYLYVTNPMHLHDYSSVSIPNLEHGILIFNHFN